MNLHNYRVLRLSSVLKKYSSLHSILKKIYFKFNYFLFADKKFRYKIINGVACDIALNQDQEFFFGYYHHSPWSYDDSFLAINSIVDSETIEVNIITLATSEIIFSDKTTLWNFQQGPMLGWIPGKNIIYYNKLIDNTYKTVLYNLNNKQLSNFNYPIQTVHPTGEYYLSINYSKLATINKDYSYKQKCNNLSNNNNGIWKCYFDNNINPELMIVMDDMERIDNNFSNNYNNELNHCVFSSDGKHFLFIYRYKSNGNKYSQLILSKAQSSNKNMIKINNLFISHMCWIDNENVFYFGDSVDSGKGFYIYNLTNSSAKKVMPDNTNDGHPSIHNNRKWIILDTYPDKQHNNHLYMYNIETLKLINIGKFKSDISMHGYDRCDLHPRWNNSGTQVMIDTSYKNKRYPLIIDLKEVIYEEK